MTKPRVAFFYEYPHLDTIPFIREPIRQLAADGFSVDLFAPRLKTPPAPVSGSGDIQVRYVDFASRRATARLLASLPKIAAARRYALLLANPVGALIHGAFVSRLLRVPLVAFSDELFTETDMCRMSSRRRGLMNWAHRRARFTIITDGIRAEVLRRTTGLPDSHAFYELPNSPAGLPPAVDPRDFRERLGIPLDATMLLMAGYFSPAMGSDVILNALPWLPDNTYVVFQFAVDRSSSLDTIALCKLAEKKYPVRFQFDPVPYDLVDQVIGSCDIGLVFYNSQGPNFDLCGKGSGKLCRFLRLGKPVILNQQGSLHWVARSGAGEIAHTTDELVQAILKIRADYETYSKNAVTCYTEHLAFEKYYPPIHRALRELVRPEPAR